MKTETVSVPLTPDEMGQVATKLATAEKALTSAETALDVASTQWKATKKNLVGEVDICRDEVHTLAKEYRDGAREEEVEVDERVKGDVIQTFIVGSKPVKVIRERPLESGDQTEIPLDADQSDVDMPEEAL